MARDVLAEIPASEFDGVARRACARMDGVDADEVRQEMMIRMLDLVRRDRDLFKNREHVLGRAFLEAKWVAKRLRKKSQSRRVNFSDPTTLPEPAQSNEAVEIVRLKELLADRDAVLSLLEDTDPLIRTVFSRLWDGATQQQVADELGLDRSKVFRLWQSALATLRDSLECPD
ncbi:MAG: hypothetical protein U0871_15655 [Gemmataceae bacterium]